MITEFNDKKVTNLTLLLVFGSLATSVLAQDRFVRGPQVMSVLQASAVIAWTTNSTGSNNYVEYWAPRPRPTDPDPDPRCRSDRHCFSARDVSPSRTPGNWRVVYLDELVPGVTYNYRACTTNATALCSPFFTFKTPKLNLPPETSPDFNFVVFGDSGCNGQGGAACKQLEVRNKINDLHYGTFPIDLMVHVGDIVYDCGENVRYGENKDTPCTNNPNDPCGGYFGVYGEPLSNPVGSGNLIKRIPMFTSPGNHDYDSGIVRLRCEPPNGDPPLAGVYLNNFFPPNHSSPRVEGSDLLRTKRYYSFDWGNAHFVALDTELIDPEGGRDLSGLDSQVSKQMAWLESDLASATDAVWKFVFFHKPPFTSSDFHGSSLAVRSLVSLIAQKYNVDVAFAGHDHLYERFHPLMVSRVENECAEEDDCEISLIDADGLNNGVVYIVTGGGGETLYTPETAELYCDPYAAAQCRAFVASYHHVTKVFVDNLPPVAGVPGLNLNIETAPIGGTPDSARFIKGILRGTVKSNADNNSAIANATLTTFIKGDDLVLRQRDIKKSLKDGSYVFYLLTSTSGRTYTVRSEAPGFSTCTGEIFIPSGSTKTANFILGPTSCQINCSPSPCR